MKRIFLIFSTILILGCIYDPPTKGITIFNNTDRAIYVHYSCSGKMEKSAELVLFRKNADEVQSVDEYDLPKPSTSSPEYRVNAFSYSQLGGFGNGEKRELLCGNSKNITVFFISEDTMKAYNWNTICNRNLYNKRMEISKEVLDSLKWTVFYNQDLSEISSK